MIHEVWGFAHCMMVWEAALGPGACEAVHAEVPGLGTERGGEPGLL